MYHKLLSVIIISLSLSSAAVADFPTDEVWSVEFDTTVSCLGPNWQEDGQTHFLVGLENQVVILSADEIVWESLEFGGGHLPETVTAVKRIDFGDGPEIVVATYQTWDGEGERVAADSGKVYYFGGDGYEDVLVRSPFTRTAYIDGGTLDERMMPSIGVFSNMLPDESKTLLTLNTYYYTYPPWAMSWWEGRLYSVGDEVGLGQEIQGLATTTKYFTAGNGFQYLIYGYRHALFNHRSRSGAADCGLVLINDRLRELTHRRLFETGDIPLIFNPRAGYCKINDIAIQVQNDDTYIFTAYSDTATSYLQALSWSNLAIGDRLDLSYEGVEDVSIAYFPWGDLDQGENMLACISSEGEVVTVDPAEMIETDRGDINVTCVGTAVGNFDDDEQLELAILSRRSLNLFNVTPLSTPTQRHPHTPATYSIISAYPNPFNSRTVIEYTLPKASRHALIVYDVNGAEVTRLADEWRSAGTHQAVWDASGVTSGTYFIQLGVEGRGDVQTVRLIR